MYRKDYLDNLSKIKKFLKGIGYTLIINKKERSEGDPAYCEYDVPQPKVVIFKKRTKSKKQFILYLIHECAHAYVMNVLKIEPSKELTAIHETPADQLNRAQREMIYRDEARDLLYMIDIYFLLKIKGLKVGEVLDSASEDVANYRCFAQKGRFPKYKEVDRELNKLLKTGEFKIFERIVYYLENL